jgi:hypothetical protein
VSAQGARAIAALFSSASRRVLTSTSTIATSTRSDCQHDRGKHDHVDGKDEYGRVPDTRSRPNRAALCRNPIVITQAVTSISDIGAT